jgi:hypothetical protein
MEIKEKVKHVDAKQELIHKQEVRIKRVNNIIRQLPPSQVQVQVQVQVKKRNIVRGNMKLIVNGQR